MLILLNVRDIGTERVLLMYRLRKWVEVWQEKEQLVVRLEDVSGNKRSLSLKEVKNKQANSSVLGGDAQLVVSASLLWLSRTMAQA